MSGSISVVGGTGGTDVEYDDLAAAARVLQSAAADLTETAWSVRGVLSDASLLASALLDPGGAARVEAAVMAAIAGPHGLLRAATALETRSLSLRAAVARYVAADHLGTAVREARQWAEGAAAALALPLIPLVALTPIGFGLAGNVSGADVSTFLAEHPGVAEDAAGATPAFLDTVLLVEMGALGPIAQTAATSRSGNLLPVATIDDAARLLGSFYPPGAPVVTGRGTDVSAPPAPRGVADLLTALEHRDRLCHGDTQGEIDVRRLTRAGPDGKLLTSWVVDLPGTKAWQPDPRDREHLNDMATNLATMAGSASSRVDGVTQALRLAGVRPGEPVMLVGHSQGGLVALRAAEQYARDGSFSVTHVVTSGSPVARMPVPASVSVLALENRYDVVPQLDGRPSPPEANRVTVVFDAQHHDVGLNHAMATAYAPAGPLIDADMTQPSLAAWRDGAGAFLAAPDVPVQVRTTVWDISNRT
jgi:pimeloyl-ACP methyl ester carboxylesterase